MSASAIYIKPHPAPVAFCGFLFTGGDGGGWEQGYSPLAASILQLCQVYLQHPGAPNNSLHNNKQLDQ
jgi:hypothetical protein